MPGAFGANLHPSVTLNVVPREQGSLVVLSYLPGFTEPLRPFLDQFRPPIGEEEFVEKIWETALRYAENIIVAPIHWNNVPNNVQRSIMDFHSATVCYGGRRCCATFLSSSGRAAQARDDHIADGGERRNL